MSAAADAILVKGLRLWAHVGVFEAERRSGQWFEVSYELLTDLDSAASHDDLNASLDYSTGITALQALARTLVCRTLEHLADRLLDRLEHCYGPVPILLEVSKCAAPIPGFTGSVAVRRARRWKRGA